MKAKNAVLLTLGLSVAGATVAAPAPIAAFSFDTAFGRLPKNVVPIDYSISVTPDVQVRTLTGTEKILLQFRSATDTIVFNSLNETLRDVLLDGKPVKTVVSNDEKQLTSLTLNSPAAIGRHTLTFSYDGKMESGPRGMFAQPYVKPDGGKGLLVSTKFESTDARRMFPCWDEPAFRSTFELSATVPAAWAVVSNMPIAKRVTHQEVATTTFKRSPKMPTYLVEFSAGDLADISAQSDGVTLGIWAVRGQEQDGAVALANARQILADYDEYFGFHFPLPKLDSIAVPGGFSGAMENWGAITYNDQLLLFTKSSTLSDRQIVFSVQAHEMAHQWNGDLVTMGWWDDIWLNESFASWRAAKETDLRNPSWNWLEGEDEGKERAMQADARSTSHAIAQHVVDELQVTNAFDQAITYNKGEAVLRMLEAYLGEDTFRDGVRRFMKAHAYSNATSTDLWNALSAASGRDVGAIASSWIQQPGFPLVAVTASCDSAGKRSVSLQQRRFLLQGADSSSLQWNIPIRIRSGATGTAQTQLVTQAVQAIPAGRCDESLSLNVGTIGYYRVQYDDATLKVNTDGFASLPNPDRIALLDDQWALVETGRKPLSSYLTLASSMGLDLDQRAWSQIVQALGTIEYDERGRPGHDAFAAYARSIIKPVSEKLGWEAKPDETPGIQRLRRTILADLGAWGDRDVIAEARKRFAAFVMDHKAISPDDQEFVLGIVARNADAATFEQLHGVAKAATNETEQRRYYLALMVVRDPKLATQAAALAISPEIPPQAGATRLSLVATMVSESPQLAWATFTQNLDMLMVPQGRYAPLITAQYIPEGFWNAAPLDQLESWIRAHVPAEMSDNVSRGMESAHFKLDEKTRLAEAADGYMRSR